MQCGVLSHSCQCVCRHGGSTILTCGAVKIATVAIALLSLAVDTQVFKCAT